MFYSFSRFGFFHIRSRPSFPLSLAPPHSLWGSQFFFASRAFTFLCLLQIIYTNLVSFRVLCVCVSLQCLSSLITFFPHIFWYDTVFMQSDRAERANNIIIIIRTHFFLFFYTFMRFILYGSSLVLSIYSGLGSDEIKCVYIHLFCDFHRFWTGSMHNTKHILEILSIFHHRGNFALKCFTLVNLRNLSNLKPSTFNRVWLL